MRALALILVLVSSFTVAADSRSDLVVGLRFVPQEGVDAPSPDITTAMNAKPVRISIEDARSGTDSARIGRGTNDDDETFQIRTAADPVAFFRDTITGVLADWSLQSKESSERALRIDVTKYQVVESNKAVGSMYTADVTLRCALTDEDGKVLAEIAASGTANRYGRARSADNCNEVLSDALKAAVAQAVSDPTLQKAWVDGIKQGAAPAEPGRSVEERLARLEELLEKGVITKEEYERKRAEILSEL